jgi:murein DD-endopeptidase MepM/ murein hydrolase activator NlpD
MGLALRSGVDGHHFASWLERADPATRRALKHMRPGDDFSVCLAPSATGGNTLVSLRITRDEAGRKRAARQTGRPVQPATSPFADVTAEVTSTARLVPEKATLHPGLLPADTRDAAATASPLIKPLMPGRRLGEELTRVLGRHPVVAAITAYVRKQWHLPERLPRGSRCTLALLPGGKQGVRMQLAYIQLDYRGRKDRVYHYVDSRGHDFMVGARGRGYRVLDPLPPVPDARISSGWGWRTQPVLGGDEFHRGIDYAAPLGTPVRAAMDGVVDMSGWRGGYGRLVEIRHAGDLSTRYGHLHAFAPHIHVGSHVHRGDVIGYVGSSGLSTGPHLYYEVWDHGRRINPLTHRQWMVAVRLDPHERQRLDTYVNRVLAAP